MVAMRMKCVKSFEKRIKKIHIENPQLLDEVMGELRCLIMQPKKPVTKKMTLLLVNVFWIEEGVSASFESVVFF